MRQLIIILASLLLILTLLPVPGYAEILTMPYGYRANIAATQSLNIVYIQINAYHSSDEIYNVCDLELGYDAEKLRFDCEKSSIGCAMYRDINGRLRLIDFGADKALGESIYVLAFQVINAGEAKIQLNSAAFSTAEKAATEDIEPIINTPNTISINKSKTIQLHRIRFTGYKHIIYAKQY